MFFSSNGYKSARSNADACERRWKSAMENGNATEAYSAVHDYEAGVEKEREAFRAWADDARITLRAYVMTGVPGGGRKSDLSDVIARYEARAEEFDAMERKTDEERSKILRIKSAVDDVVAELEMAQRKVLEYSYIDGHGWRYIAMRMNDDERQVRRLESQAVDFSSERVEVQKLGEK